MQSGWRTARSVDSERAPRGGSSKRGGGSRFNVTETKVRIHLSNPEELYDHPGGVKLPFLTGLRYYAPFLGENGKYFFTDEKTIIDAWRDPKKFNLDLKPLAKMQDVRGPDIFYAISGWVEEWFHVVENRNQRTGSKYHSRELCTGHKCEYCDKGLEKVFGKKVHFIFSQSQWDGAFWIANEVAQSRCKCGGRVYVSYYACSKCDEGIIDFASSCYNCRSENLTLDESSEEFCCDDCGTSWSMFPFNNADLYKDVSARRKCSCGNEDYLKPVQFCTSCGEDYDSHDLMDYRMKINAVQKGKAKVVSITNMEVAEPDQRLFEAKFQAPNDPELGEKIAKANKTPIDLRKVCAPLDHDVMAEMLKVGNPFSMGSGDAEFTNFSRHESGNGRDKDSEEDSKKSKPVGKPHTTKGRSVGRPTFSKPRR